VIESVGPIPVNEVAVVLYLVAMFTVTTCKILPAVAVVAKVPEVDGKVNTVDPATAGACINTEPEVSPRRSKELIGLPT
jgi:hypothetical protein